MSQRRRPPLSLLIAALLAGGAAVPASADVLVAFTFQGPYWQYSFPFFVLVVVIEAILYQFIMGTTAKHAIAASFLLNAASTALGGIFPTELTIPPQYFFSAWSTTLVLELLLMRHVSDFLQRFGHFKDSRSLAGNFSRALAWSIAANSLSYLLLFGLCIFMMQRAGAGDWHAYWGELRRWSPRGRILYDFGPAILGPVGICCAYFLVVFVFRRLISRRGDG